MKNPILYPFLWCALSSFLFSFNSYGQKASSASGKTNQSSDQMDVYVCGSWYDPKTYQSFAAYWKNGKPVTLKEGQPATNFQAVSCARSIAVNGSDVRVVGERLDAQNNKIAAYWKNQKLQPLQIKPTKNGNIGSSSIGGVETVNGQVCPHLKIYEDLDFNFTAWNLMDAKVKANSRFMDEK